MRGRGRGINQPKWTRGSGHNHPGMRNSTRNWEKAPGDGATTVPKTTPGTNKTTKPDDRSGLQWIPSVSRSSGLEPNGDALRSLKTQEEYWLFITEKILNLEVPGRLVVKSAAERQEKESNAMILLRKLREGFIATNRRDQFANQVVEKSVYLSLLYNSTVNIASSFSYFIDDLGSSSSPTETKPAVHQPAIGLVHFLYTLIDEFPSQRVSHRLLRPTTGQRCLLPPDSPEWTIAYEIASALRRNNWWTLEQLTRPPAVHKRLPNEPWAIPHDSASKPESESRSKADVEQDDVFAALPQRALVHLLQQLRVKVRGSAWPVLRSAYREVVDVSWLERSLLLPQANSDGLVEFMRSAVGRSEAAVKDTPGAASHVWILRRPARPECVPS